MYELNIDGMKMLTVIETIKSVLKKTNDNARNCFNWPLTLKLAINDLPQITVTRDEAKYITDNFKHELSLMYYWYAKHIASAFYPLYQDECDLLVEEFMKHFKVEAV